MRRVERSVSSANREVGRFSRGALVGTGALQGLGRAAAFASVSFIGGAGLVYAFKSTIAAAMESQVVLGQTENAVKRSGASWSQWGDEIQRVALEQANLAGFDDERLLRTFSTLVRRTGDVTKAFQLNGLAADVARGRNIELEQATQLVLRASLGQAGALRRLGIEARVGASRLELIQLLNEKYAGSAAKFADTAAGAQARFNVAVGNTQELIGQALLPTLTEYLNRATEWLNNSENQERIQKDVKTAVDFTSSAVDRLATAIGGVSSAISYLHGLPGGDTGIVGIIAGGDRGRESESRLHKFGGLVYDVAAAIHLVGDETKRLNTAEDLLWASRKRRQLQPATGIWGIPNEVFNQGGLTNRKTGDPGSPFSVRSGNQNEMTATALAKAQASGDREAITAAVKARQQFVRETISFANKLISQGRGDTGKLYTTLQSFYGEQESLGGILQAFTDADERADKDAAAAAKERIRKAKERAKAWRERNHDLQLALAEVRKRMRTFSEAFSESIRQQARESRDRQTQRFETSVQIAENAISRAQLIGNKDSELEAERKARVALIDLYRERVATLKSQHAGLAAITRAQADVYAARKALRDLNKRETGDKGFTLQELFAEAGQEFQLYGGNVGSVLSAQDARGAFAGTVKSHQTTVVQNFYGERSSGQALADAARVAKNMKAG